MSTQQPSPAAPSPGVDSSALEAAEARLDAVAGEIRDLLRADLQRYIERELRRRFVERAEVASGMTPAGIKVLRANAREASAAFLADLDVALGDPGTWRALLDAGEDAPPPGKDLREVADVWQAVAAVDAVVESLAEPVGLGVDDRDPPGYQPPMRFIDGAYLPSLVERYGRVIGELRTLRAAKAEADAVAQAEALAARWDEAAPDA